MHTIPKRKKKAPKAIPAPQHNCLMIKDWRKADLKICLPQIHYSPSWKCVKKKKFQKICRTIFILIYSAENKTYPYLFPKQLTFLSEAPDVGLLVLSFPKVLLSFLRNREKNSSDNFYQFIFCSYKNCTHTHIFPSTLIQQHLRKVNWCTQTPPKKHVTKCYHLKHDTGTQKVKATIFAKLEHLCKYPWL